MKAQVCILGYISIAFALFTTLHRWITAIIALQYAKPPYIY